MKIYLTILGVYVVLLVLSYVVFSKLNKNKVSE